MEEVRPKREAAAERDVNIVRVLGTIATIVVAVAGIYLLLRPANPEAPQLQPFVPRNTNLLTLAPAAFLAGVLSFLSPCTLPILPAYFAFTFGKGEEGGRGKVVLSSLIFFAGLATTFTILSASLTALGQLFLSRRDELQRIGGVVIIGFGLMSILGKGFSGLTIKRQSGTGLLGTYLYGMTFALGWTACIGPILGTIMTLLITQGGTMLAGALLSLIYVLGLGLPLMLVAVFFNRLGQGSRAWRYLRGRGWEVRVAGRTLYLHSTSVISGLLLVGVGLLLVSGQLAYFNSLADTGLAQWVSGVEEHILRFFRGY